MTRDPTCEYGCPVVCGRAATWECYPPHYPGTCYACDEHAPLMTEVLGAKRLSFAPPMSMGDLRRYITALAWAVYLSTDIRKLNAQSGFRLARDEWHRRFGEAR